MVLDNGKGNNTRKYDTFLAFVLFTLLFAFVDILKNNYENMYLIIVFGIALITLIEIEKFDLGTQLKKFLSLIDLNLSLVYVFYIATYLILVVYVF
ncbi:hypothetical protein [Cytobacillus horneckiae]|uniref:hypothetical protein n=1 Tax=Cytobacillus horneckiae TaxID=549687 RepID=UPI003D9A75C6